MPILTNEQVQQLTIPQCEEALRLLNKTYDIEKPMISYKPGELPNDDDICNTLLYLEDRIAYIKMVDHLNSVRHTLDKDPVDEI